MLTSRRFARLKNSEQLPVIVMAVAIVTFVHLCNKHDEQTANQYMLKDHNQHDQQMCSLYPSSMQGVESPDVISDFRWSDVEQLVTNVRDGGSFTPTDCSPRQQLAIIIPLRHREYQLKLLLRHLHPFLQRQKRAYRIFVVEQFGNGTFNKGLIMNVAFRHASSSLTPKFDCFLFHDVDMLPENDFNAYECEKIGPRHLAPAVDELRYFLMYNELVGGALALTHEQFMRANGWSNLYWGWGLEDDDMHHRLIHAGYRIGRPPNHIGRYKMIRHAKQIPSVQRYGVLSKWHRYPYDGVRQLKILNYSLVHIDKRLLYTHILVNFTRSATKTIDHLLEDEPKII